LGRPIESSRASLNYALTFNLLYRILALFENKMYLSKKFKTQMLTLNTYIVASTFESAYAMNIGFESKTC
jgi:hypothetical protein